MTVCNTDISGSAKIVSIRLTTSPSGSIALYNNSATWTNITVEETSKYNLQQFQPEIWAGACVVQSRLHA